MATHTIRGLLNELTTYQQRLEQGELQLEELNQLVQLSQELLERYTILRYKAYEGKEIREEVYQNESESEEHGTWSMDIQSEKESESEEHGAMSMDDQSESESESEEHGTWSMEKQSESESESEEHGTWSMEKQSESESESEEQNSEAVAFDFSLFDDTAEEVQDTLLEENAVEHVSISAVTEEVEGISEQKITMEQVIQTPVADDNKAFIKHFSAIEPGFFSQIGMSHLDTLIGSFGLNERLQYINELFNGSSEAFSDAVKRLDQVGSYQDALIEASKYAHEFDWDIESETVEELVTKLKRRHG